jgi:hypothetical protein
VGPKGDKGEPGPLRPAHLQCQIIYRGNPRPGDNDSLANTEYNTTCPAGHDHILNAQIYSAGKPSQWQSLCCRVEYR